LNHRLYTNIYSTQYAFAALKADGSITAWGHSAYGGAGAPTDSGYTNIYSTGRAFMTRMSFLVIFSLRASRFFGKLSILEVP
jgi:alpha-tubulin suppressor-like RCC1 family protein